MNVCIKQLSIVSEHENFIKSMSNPIINNSYHRVNILSSKIIWSVSSEDVRPLLIIESVFFLDDFLKFFKNFEKVFKILLKESKIF